MVYAVTASVISFLISRLTKYTGVQTMLIIMLLAALCQAIFMISWTPTVSQSYVIFIMAANFGLTQSLANTQIRAAFGVFFPNDPTAYSGAILFETMGLIIGSILSIFVQTRIKIYVYIVVIFTSVISYLWLEARNGSKKLEAEKSSEEKPVAMINYEKNVTFEIEDCDQVKNI